MAIARTGDSLIRVEDVHLLTGDTTFVANAAPDAAFVHYVTSSFAHALIVGIDVSEAAAAPGVLAVVTGTDLEAAGRPSVMPGLTPPHPSFAATPVLARDRVRFVGEAIVAIVAETEAQAADAAELVVVDFDPLAPVIDLATAHQAEPIFEAAESNVLVTEERPDSSPIDFSQFEVVVRSEFNNNRVHPAPLEGRVASARWIDGRLEQHAACQGVHPMRNALASWYGLEHDQIRVTTSDVGGSFGAKARAYPEDLLLGHLAQVVGRPVVWTPPRSADMVGLGHSRAQLHDIVIAGDRDGRLRALQAHVRTDTGAYPAAGLAQARNATRMLPGPFDIEHVHWTLDAVATNTTPIVAYRGAGRPESGSLLNRAIDLFASEIGIDPIEVMKRNLLPASALPFTSAGGVIYDSGDYPGCLDVLLRELDLDSLRAEQTQRRNDNDVKMLGVGVAMFVDRTAGVPGAEYGAVHLQPDGSFVVHTGSSPYGQGHYTTWIQLVSERTGAAVESISVFHGDTDVVPRGGITGGSRSAQKAGSAVAVATETLVDEARAHAARMLEAAEADVVLDLERGHFHVTGSPGAATVGWAEIAALLIDDAANADDDTSHVMKCEADFEPDNHSVPYGAYAAVVEVDRETGAVTLLRMVTVDDAGTMINPMIVLGQVHGAVVQGIGQALYEEFVYDDAGNPLTGDLLSYTMPSAVEIPPLEAHMTEHPSPNNPLGAKGIGESGCIGAVPAIQNAVIDALRPLGIHHIDLPLSPQRVWHAIQQAGIDLAVGETDNRSRRGQ
ncbi:MAG: xanthine dehydrogenase family protein molybdopterin-binding subunit [Acidimicrobiaceae bacterium]|nr:xanthine dehydrogenase family protein molybdopterin-binding subunit [Acidimicrobiaceae bacterium]